MEEEPRTERSSAASSSQHLDQAPADPDPPVDPQAEFLVPSFSPPSAPSSPGPTGTLSRISTSLRAQAQAMSGGPAGSGAPLSPTDRGQVSAITVMTLLDKVVNMLESVQENQQRMEQRQAELEGAVRTVQGDVTRLSKVHLNTANNVNKLLERSRKVSGGVKEVKERLEKQATQVKRLENNHAHLLKRNHFKVLIFQEDNEIPTDVFVKDSLKSPLPPFDEESGVAPPSVAPSVAGSIAPSVAGSIAPSVAGSVDMRSPDEGLHNVTLSSDEEDEMTAHQRLLAEIDADSTTGLGSSRTFERRSDRFKRNSLKKVDSLKKAFSKQNIEKKVTQITTKIVPPEKREKIIKSFSPNHPKSPTAKTSSFKVSPMTFNVKKQVRDGQTPVPEASPPAATAHVEIPALGLEEPLEIPGSADLRDGAVKAVAEVRQALSEVGVGEEISVNGEVNGAIEHLTEEDNLDQEKIPEEISQAVAQVSPSSGAGPGLAVPESLDDVGEDEEEEEGEEEGPTAAEPAITAAVTVETPAVNIAVEQAS